MNPYSLPQTSTPRRRRRRRRGHPLRRLVAVLLLIDTALFLVILCSGPKTAFHTSAPIAASSLSDSETALADADGTASVLPTDERDSNASLLNTEEIPERLLELAEANPETLDFVQQYPEKHDQHPEIDLSAEARSETVPLLLQWDTRWGYEPYGDGMIGYTGCGPTCLSMVALYLTGDASYSPLAVARYAEDSGYYVNGKGTAWSMMTDGVAHFGLRSEELPLSQGSMQRALDAGKPIICVVGPGDFTPNGHFLVVTGYTGEGFTVNDPNSVIRSGQIWSFDRLSGQIRNLWAFSLS